MSPAITVQPPAPAAPPPNPFAQMVQSCIATPPSRGGLGRPLRMPQGRTNTDTMLQLLREFGPMSSAELAHLMDFSTQQVWGLFKGPRERGVVTYLDGTWRISQPPAPKASTAPSDPLPDAQRLELAQLRNVVNGALAAAQYFATPRLGHYDEQGRFVPHHPGQVMPGDAQWVGGPEAAKLLGAALRFWA